MKPIPDYLGYFATKTGRIFSRISRGGKGKLFERAPQKHTSGYRYLVLAQNKKPKVRFIHHLILETFVGPRPTPLHECDHYDGNRTNNNLRNLKWVTRKENIHSTMRRGKHTMGESHGMAKLTEQKVLKIRMMAATGKYSFRGLARMFNVTDGMIHNIVKRRNWRHI